MVGVEYVEKTWVAQDSRKILGRIHLSLLALGTIADIYKEKDINMVQTIGSILLPIIGGYLLSKVDPISTFFSQYLHASWQLPALLSLILLLCVLIPYRCKSHISSKLATSKDKAKIINAFAVNHPDDIIIKAIADDAQNFKTIPDIARETDLPLKQINSFVDFLIMNNFATEEKIRYGKTYILTPQGREAFKQQIEK